MTSPAAPTSRAGGRRDVAQAIAVGVLAGFLSGLFGVGGGILIVPGLVLLAHMGQRLAHGTSLAAIIPIAASGVLGYLLDGKVDGAATLCLAIGAMGGAVVGTKLLHVLPQHTLRIAFALVLLATAARLLLDEGDPSGRGDFGVTMAIVFVLVGIGAGVLSGLLGVGGGIVMVPVMMIGFDIPAAIAKGTSLAVIIPTSMVGTWRNARAGNLDVRAATLVGCAGVATAFAGARVSIIMSDTLSSVLFGTLLVATAARMLLDDRRERREQKETQAQPTVGEAKPESTSRGGKSRA